MSSQNIFIAATRQNDGKTTVCLGLIACLKKRYKNIGFIKPIGQRYLEEQGVKVDEDSVLIEDACGIRCGLKDMSPIAVEKGFTENYILHPDKDKISSQIQDSYQRVSQDKDLVVIEGTGHAGVGSVFDHSNAYVARMLGAKVVLVSSGGVGRPIDEILLNRALFLSQGVELAGVVVNKVRGDKFDKVDNLVRRGLGDKGVEVLGVIPYQPCLSAPKIGRIVREADFRLVCGEAGLDNVVLKIVVGAMAAHKALDYLGDCCLLITPGDREDIIMTALSCHIAGVKGCIRVSGVVITGGIMPHKTIIDFIRGTDVPLISSDYDTYKVASIIHDLTVKIDREDKDKIKEAVDLVGQCVEIDKLLLNLTK